MLVVMLSMYDLPLTGVTVVPSTFHAQLVQAEVGAWSVELPVTYTLAVMTLGELDE